MVNMGSKELSKSEKLKVTPVNSSCIVSSGRTPRESSPHSLRRASHTLKKIPLLIPGVLTKRLSVSRAAIFVRLSAGCLSASVSRWETLKVIWVMGEDMKWKALITYRRVWKLRMSTFTGGFCLCNHSAYIWCWIFQTSSDNLGSCFFDSSPLEESMIHEQSIFRSGYSRTWQNRKK